MKLTSHGSGLGRFILSPVAVIAMLALLTTSVALAVPPNKEHPPVDQPTASSTVDESESPEADDFDALEASHSPGACNALHGNAPAVIAELVANWPTKHAKGDVPGKLPPGLQKVAERLAACPPLDGTPPDETPTPEATPTPQPTPSPIVVDDEGSVLATGKKADNPGKANGRKP